MLAETIVYDLIKDIFLLLDDGDRRLLSTFDLTIPRFYALLHLGHNPGLSPNQLSERMFCDKSNITRLIKGMEDDGLVSRQPHEHDGRSIRLFLTASGSKVRDQAIEAHRMYIQYRFQSDQLIELDCLKRALQSLKENLQHKLPQGSVGVTRGGGA